MAPQMQCDFAAVVMRQDCAAIAVNHAFTNRVKLFLGRHTREWAVVCDMQDCVEIGMPKSCCAVKMGPYSQESCHLRHCLNGCGATHVVSYDPSHLTVRCRAQHKQL